MTTNATTARLHTALTEDGIHVDAYDADNGDTWLLVRDGDCSYWAARDTITDDAVDAYLAARATPMPEYKDFDDARDFDDAKEAAQETRGNAYTDLCRVVGALDASSHDIPTEVDTAALEDMGEGYTWL